MFSLSKIALAGLLAYSAQGRSARADDAEFQRRFGRANQLGKRGGMGGPKQNPFDEGVAYYRGACQLRNADGQKSGKVVFHSELTDQVELTSVSARARGAGADRVAMELYDADPTTLTAD